MIFKNPVYKNKGNVTINNIGGIVSSNHPAFINTDRLSDGYNVWNKNGILSSRPGICALEDGIVSNDITSENVKIYYSNFPYEDVKTYNNFCALVKDCGFSGTKIKFFAIDINGTVHSIADLDLKNSDNTQEYNVKNVIFIKSKKISGSGIFIILPVLIKNSSSADELKKVLYYELSSDYSAFIEVLPENMYRPVIIKNGYGDVAPSHIKSEFKESRPEGVSLLNGLFEARFILDGVSSRFRIPTSIAKDADIEIHYYITEDVYYTATIKAGDFKSETFDYVGSELYFTVDRDIGKIFVQRNSEGYAMFANTNTESLRIFSRSDVMGADYEIFSSCVTPLLFDNRLFIAGGENRGNKVYYSSKTEHLYFCDEYSVSVGNKSYDLTSLSMQSKYIIAFKERELYRLSFQCTEEVSVEKFEKKIMGISFEKPKCTVTQINDTIGCDLPDTIVTCANRLVWFHSDGIVYTLYGSNLYTEGSIYDLSSDISNLLSNLEKSNLKKAFAADFNGYYALGICDRIFLMDVRVSGFRYLSNTIAKNRNNLGWFLWYAPENTSFISGFVCGGKEYLILASDKENVIYTANLSGDKDIIISDKEFKEQVYNFSFSTAIFSDYSNNLERICFNALVKNPAEFTVFDENCEIESHLVNADNQFKSYILPAPYKKGGIGIKINGSGDFKLKDIICCFKERIY